MADKRTPNTYEEARKQQLLENRKRFEDLGILKISKSLSDLSKSERKPQKQRQVKPKSGNVPIIEPRRSSRARNPVPSYRDDVDTGLPPVRKRSKYNSSWASYLVRPLEEVKTPSYEERVNAIKCAEKLQSNLQSEYPSFVKSMVRSHVYSCFWLGLPTRFCEEHLPKSTVNMVLEDENGAEYDAIFISKRTGLSGGWRAFALDHKLDDGDALVFELVKPTRFKICIVKASDSTSPDDDMSDDEAKETAIGKKKKINEKSDSPTKNVKKTNAKNSTKRKKSGTTSQTDDAKETCIEKKLNEKSDSRRHVKKPNAKSLGQEIRRSRRNM